ncbi:Uncharacterised protein [uncultured Clostridium sp.]|nr:Uncharacterised protein [uncultured Clostridium sp.]SCH66907.1 Uncharacterised protein [uncultured Clostridium sp.]
MPSFFKFRTIEESRIENCYGMRMQEEDLRMQWAENLYLSDKTAKKKDKIIKKANRGVGMVSIYFITLASNRENLFDIFHAAHLKQPAFYKQDLYVVGIASGYEEALELVQRMIDDIYRKTGGFAVREYFGRTEN